MHAYRLGLLVGLMLVLLIRCSSGDDTDEQPAAVPAPPPAVSTGINLTGNYRGTFASTIQVGTGTVAIQFFQTANNPTVTGTITFTGSLCFRAGTIVGTLSGNAFEGTVQFGGGLVITLMATVSSDGVSASGGYAVNMNSSSCSRDQGQFTIVRQ